MDMQLKRGFLDVLVLSTLLKKNSYGYQIIKDLAPVTEISESTLYPILKRLEASNFLTDRKSTRLNSSHPSRSRMPSSA
mgnify:CR=1 FL=1